MLLVFSFVMIDMPRWVGSVLQAMPEPAIMSKPIVQTGTPISIDHKGLDLDDSFTSTQNNWQSLTSEKQVQHQLLGLRESALMAEYHAPSNVFVNKSAQ